jgi:hypothetical protein
MQREFKLTGKNLNWAKSEKWIIWKKFRGELNTEEKPRANRQEFGRIKLD